MSEDSQGSSKGSSSDEKELHCHSASEASSPVSPSATSNAVCHKRVNGTTVKTSSYFRAAKNKFFHSGKIALPSYINSPRISSYNSISKHSRLSHRALKRTSTVELPRRDAIAPEDYTNVKTRPKLSEGHPPPLLIIHSIDSLDIEHTRVVHPHHDEDFDRCSFPGSSHPPAMEQQNADEVSSLKKISSGSLTRQLSLRRTLSAPPR